MYKALGLIASTAKNRKRKEKKGGGEREGKEERKSKFHVPFIQFPQS
jgi:hypothetical protein